MKDVIRGLLSRPALQPALLQLLKLCHAGLNYGGGQTVKDSGEVGALAFALRSLQRPAPRTLFDVGANDGEYLEAALKAMGPDARVYSFEPQSSSFETLRTRFESDPRVQLRKLALGREEATVDLFFGSDREPTASLHRNTQSGPVRSESVHITTIDRLCAEESIEHIDILKIDTEGHEMEVLLGASQLMRADHISCIQFEFGDTFLGTPYHLKDVWDLLSPQYTIYRILRRGLIEVPCYSHDLEIYKIANFLCIHQ
jgi:FkbM family methyltransferase